MADVYRDWVLYNVGKAIKNGNEYPFDWTMLNEYNQLIAYYDTAQQQIRTSIINKWVYVPANATIDTYHNYIDLIETNKNLLSWLKAGYVNTGWYYWPNMWPCISFEEWWIYYGMCAAAEEMKSSNTAYSGIDCFRKASWQDVQHRYQTWDSYNWYYSYNRVQVARYYKNSTTIRCYFCIEYTPTSNPNYYMMYKTEWDYKNGTYSSRPTLIWSDWYNTDPTHYWEDLTWLTEITWTNSRVSSCVWERSGDDWWIYLVLK